MPDRYADDRLLLSRLGIPEEAHDVVHARHAALAGGPFQRDLVRWCRALVAEVPGCPLALDDAGAILYLAAACDGQTLAEHAFAPLHEARARLRLTPLCALPPEQATPMPAHALEPTFVGAFWQRLLAMWVTR